MTARSTVWFQRAVANPEAGQRLICFPHAGGSAAFFRHWGRRLPGLEVQAVRYPGRAERIDEPPPTDVRHLARQIAAAAEPLSDRPLALFGHSMGAVVALETARALEARGLGVVHLFASGSRDGVCPAPAAPDEDNATMARQLVSLGGMDPELAADPQFLELVLPYIRSDSRMFHSYSFSPEPVLRCPVTSIVGSADSDADQRPWREVTRTFREHTTPGNHFYLISDPPLTLIRETLASESLRRGLALP
jgi:surfactin synthase thioesterase subunit